MILIKLFYIILNKNFRILFYYYKYEKKKVLLYILKK